MLQDLEEYKIERGKKRSISVKFAVISFELK